MSFALRRGPNVIVFSLAPNGFLHRVPHVFRVCLALVTENIPLALEILLARQYHEMTSAIRGDNLVC